MRTVIFDLDGTLADTSRDLIGAANWCFREMGHGDILDPVADARVAFRGGRAMLVEGLDRVHGNADASVVDAYYPKLLEAYRQDIDRHTTFYPGAIESVETLKARGFAVGICTNKPEALAELLMTRLGMRNAFGSLIGADTLPVRKPDPAPYFESVIRAGGQKDRSLLVGDTETDRKTAKAAFVPCVMVGFGPDGDSVADLNPDAIISHFDELAELAERLLP